MAISVHCQCGKTLRVKLEMAGRRVRCRYCKTPIEVPPVMPPSADGVWSDIPLVTRAFPLATAPSASSPAGSHPHRDDDLLNHYLQAGNRSGNASDNPVGLVPQRRTLRDGATMRQKQIIIGTMVAVGLFVGIPTGLLSERLSLIPIAVLTISWSLICIASIWLVFEKAGFPGWYSLVPIANVFYLHDIADIPRKLCALYFTPVAIALLIQVYPYPELSPGVVQALAFLLLANQIVIVGLISVVNFSIARNFDRGILFSIGTVFGGASSIRLLRLEARDTAKNHHCCPRSKISYLAISPWCPPHRAVRNIRTARRIVQPPTFRRFLICPGRSNRLQLSEFRTRMCIQLKV